MVMLYNIKVPIKEVTMKKTKQNPRTLEDFYALIEKRLKESNKSKSKKF